MLTSFPQEVLKILMSIMENLGESQLLATRLVSRSWNDIATEVLSKVHSPVKLQTTMCIKSFAYLMANRSQPKMFTKFEFSFENPSLQCIQQFASEVGPHVREYAFTRCHIYSHEQILTLILSSPQVKVITLQGVFLHTKETSNCASNFTFPNYMHLSVLNCEDVKPNFLKELKFLVDKAPNLKLIYLDFGGEESEHVLAVIESLLHTTKINLRLKIKNSFAGTTRLESIVSLSKTTTNIHRLSIYALDSQHQRIETAGAIAQLLKSQSVSLKKLKLESFSPYTLPSLRNLESMTLRFFNYWDIVPLSPADFPSLKKVALFNPRNLPKFSTTNWPTVTTLKLCRCVQAQPNFLGKELTAVFGNLQKLVLSSTHSIENDLKCCFRHFTKIEELFLDFKDYDDVPDLWDAITGGATYVEDLETSLDFQNKGPWPKDANLENLNLKKLTVTYCGPHTLNAILYVSLGGKFKLKLLDLQCYKVLNMKEPRGRLIEIFSKYHAHVMIH